MSLSQARPPDPQSSSIENELVLNSSTVSLPQWLEVSWFYPRGFSKERIIETPKSWIVLGREIAYKFLKVPETVPPLEPKEVFRERWRLAAEEVLDNTQLAPHLYLGLRLLRWIDDEPEWMSEKPNAELDPARPPAGADDVAIVMLRIPEERMLDRALRAGNVGERRVQAAASRLRAFHRNPRAKASSPLRDPGLFVASIVQRYIRPLQDFKVHYGSFLDPYSRIACDEIHAGLCRFIETNRSMIANRVKERAVIDCHGSLRADRMAILDRNDLAIYGRLARNDPRRISDYLTDVAAVAADLEARGAYAAARKFEEKYFGDSRAAQTPLYLFYKTAEAVRRAQVLFRGQVDDVRVQAPSYLSLALRLTLGLNKPFLAVLGGTDESAALRLGRGIGELTASSLLTVDSVPQSSAVQAPGAEINPIQLDRLLQITVHRAAVGRSSVLVWPLNREEERLRIQRAAQENNIHLLFVSLDPGKSGRTAQASERDFAGRRLRSVAGDFAQTTAELRTRHLLVEPCLAPADLALYVLRELRAEAKLATRPA